MGIENMHLHLTEEAAQLLNRYCTKRTRGAFISELVVAYARQDDLQAYVDSLLKQADDVSRKAAEAAKVLKAAQKQLR